MNFRDFFLTLIACLLFSKLCFSLFTFTNKKEINPYNIILWSIVVGKCQYLKKYDYLSMTKSKVIDKMQMKWYKLPLSILTKSKVYVNI